MRYPILKNVILVLLVGLSLISTVTGVHAQATDLHDAATQLTKNLSDDTDVQKLTGERIVIAPFENINGKGDAVPRILQEYLTTAFIKAKHFKVLERDQLQSALDELHFQLSDLADPAKAKQIGKLAGATYVLLGSISDTGKATSINARIVYIESSESIAADDVEIKSDDQLQTLGEPNPILHSAIPTSKDQLPSTPSSEEQSKINLNTNTNSNVAGYWIGSKDDFGILGKTKFNITWRENLGPNPVYAFTAGDVIGNGGKRLVELCKQENSSVAVVTVSKWSHQTFQQIWQSSETFDHPESYPYLLFSLPTSSYKSIILSEMGANKRWQWNGTTYQSEDVPDKYSDSFITDSVCDHPSIFVGTSGLSGVFTIDIGEDFDNFKNALTSDSAHAFLAPRGANCVTAGDYDGDGQIEVAVLNHGDMTNTIISIYTKTGYRKAVIDHGYSDLVRSWRPPGSKRPFIVTCRNIIDAEKKSTGGYLYFLRWNGEAYEECWKSIKLDSQIIDIQVCDPKGEGKLGLVVLTKDGSSYYLIKIATTN